MSDHYRQTMRAGRKRLVRTASVLFALMVSLLLIQAAAANADVMQKHRGAYKSKLTYYRNQMDVENTFYSAWKSGTESHINLIRTALSDPDLQKNVPMLEQVALDERARLQTATAKARDKMYANIAAFRAAGVKWFKTTKDKDRFRARLATMRSGFVEIYAADADLMSALYSLGVNADVGSANQAVSDSGVSSMTAEDHFDNGLRLLRLLL